FQMAADAFGLASVNLQGQFKQERGRLATRLFFCFLVLVLLFAHVLACLALACSIVSLLALLAVEYMVLLARKDGIRFKWGDFSRSTCDERLWMLRAISAQQACCAVFSGTT